MPAGLSAPSVRDAPGEQPHPQPGDLVECLARGDGAVGDEPSISRFYSRFKPPGVR